MGQAVAGSCSEAGRLLGAKGRDACGDSRLLVIMTICGQGEERRLRGQRQRHRRNH